MGRGERWLPFADVEMPALALFVAAGVAAMADWAAVASGARRAEHVFKPATLVLLVLAAALVDSPAGDKQGWFVVALILSLAGDVFLVLPDDYFLPGLVAFLAAHLAYIAGFVVGGVGGVGLLVGAVAAALLASQVGGRIVDAVRHRRPALARPVAVYILAISVMVALAVGSGSAWAAAGAVSFAVSDGLLGWNRFVQPIPAAPTAIMVTYHLGQGALVWSLAV